MTLDSENVDTFRLMINKGADDWKGVRGACWMDDIQMARLAIDKGVDDYLATKEHPQLQVLCLIVWVETSEKECWRFRRSESVLLKGMCMLR